MPDVAISRYNLPSLLLSLRGGRMPDVAISRYHLPSFAKVKLGQLLDLSYLYNLSKEHTWSREIPTAAVAASE